MSSSEAFSVKLYAVSLNPRILKSVNGSHYIISDITMAILYSPTLSKASGLEPDDLLKSAKISTRGSFLRTIEFQGGDDLRVMETLTKYEYENPIPSWLGWIVGLFIVMILNEILKLYGIIWIPSWFFWLIIFIPIGLAWQYIFEDKAFYIAEIYISGRKDLVKSFIRDLKNNLGREPIRVLRDKEIRLLERISGLNLSVLEAKWYEVLRD